ncbi:PEP-CTERM sorting domain-containing protein [Methylobacillus sp.]|uniref:PEP-CTERM sorting domain-containing protein n=1 Tax=Methylobacillus sp. TaxID=56818 RepID=UPI002FE17F4D
MLNFKGTMAGAVLVGMSVVSQAAFADNAKVTKFEYSDVVDVKISSNSGKSWNTVQAGAYQGTFANGDSFAAFCIEISQNLAPWGSTVSYTDGSSVYAKFTDSLTSLANKYYSFVDDAVSSAAFQIAIWEIVTEDKKGLNLDKGTFRADNTTMQVKNGWLGWKTVDNPDSLAAVTLAQTWLAGLGDDSIADTGNYSLEYLKNKKYQDLVIFTPIAAVPEPSTYGMLLLGMGLVGLFARRRTAQSIRM